MIEDTLTQLTAAINRLAQAIEQGKEEKPVTTRPRKAPPVKEEQPATIEKPAPEQPILVEEPTPEQPILVEEPTTIEEPTPEQPILVEEPAPAVTHDSIKQHIKDYRRLQAHMLSARKINHQVLLRETLDKLDIPNIDACPDERLPELWAAVEAITQPID